MLLPLDISHRINVRAHDLRAVEQTVVTVAVYHAIRCEPEHKISVSVLKDNMLTIA